jgi:hypothetical protein
MANYIFSYDLNGKRPTHEEMDKHLEASGWSVGRILETVWYIGAAATSEEVTEYATSILSGNDRYVLVTASHMTFENLLVEHKSLVEAWAAHDD